MTLFKLLVRGVAAALGAGAVVAVPEIARVLIGVFSEGPAPTDISTGAWYAIGTTFIFIINLLLSLYRGRTTQAK